MRLWTGRAFKHASKPKALMWEPPLLETVSFSHLFAYRGAFWKELKTPDGLYEDAVVGETITFTGEKDPWWRSREFVAFDIDWNNSNERLVERFRAWIERRRHQLGFKERELRGSASFTKPMRSALCAIGAWRLVHKWKMKIEVTRSRMEKGSKKGAITYTEHVSGKALFQDPLTWKRNLDRIPGPLGILPHEK